MFPGITICVMARRCCPCEWWLLDFRSECPTVPCVWRRRREQVKVETVAAVRCDCGFEGELSIGELAVLSTSDGRHSVMYRFRCPDCRLGCVRAIDGYYADFLLDSGASAATLREPLELWDAQRAAGTPISDDEAIEIFESLVSDDQLRVLTGTR